MCSCVLYLTVIDIALNFSRGTQHHYTISSRLYLNFDKLLLEANTAFMTSHTSNVTHTTYKGKLIPLQARCDSEGG
jgi:hypothetical protein